VPKSQFNITNVSHKLSGKGDMSSLSVEWASKSILRESLSSSQRLGGGSCMSSSMTYYDIHLLTSYEDDMLPFVLYKIFNVLCYSTSAQFLRSCRRVLVVSHYSCSVSRWRPQKVDKRMVLEHTHGLFIT
jgi:hypothetical protein